MAQKWPKNGLHHPMMSSSHHPIITTSHHPIIASSHLGTPHLLWKWLTNTTSQKIFLGGQTISLRFFTPQRGRIGSFGSNICSKLGQPARPQPTSKPLRPQNDPFSDKEPHYPLDANRKKSFYILLFSTISNVFRDLASEMSRGIAIEFAIHFAIDFAIHFAIDSGVDFGVDFAIDYPPHFTPPQTGPKMASSNTLREKIAPILTLRVVFAPKSSKSTPYAYL